MLHALLRQLEAQYTPEVEIIVNHKDGLTTGYKRNELLVRAKGKYTVFIDDDDEVSSSYIPLILEAAKSDPDVICFNGYMTTNGRRKQHFKISKDFEWETKNNIHYRFPNHIVPIRAEISRNFAFPDKSFAEDYEWAKLIKDSGRIKTEVRIEKDLYYYKYISRK